MNGPRTGLWTCEARPKRLGARSVRISLDTPQEERAVLRVVRCKRLWPAFENSNLTIGRMGLQSFGFHEKKRNQIPEVNANDPQHTVPDTRPAKVMRGDPPIYALATQWPMYALPPFYAYPTNVYYPPPSPYPAFGLNLFSTEIPEIKKVIFERF